MSPGPKAVELSPGGGEPELVGPSLLASSVEGLGTLFPAPGEARSQPLPGEEGWSGSPPSSFWGATHQKSTSRRRFPALCENVQFVAPSLTLKNVPLFTMLFPLITVRLQEIFLENCLRLAGNTVLFQGWKTHLNLFSFYPKKSLSPKGSDEFG